MSNTPPETTAETFSNLESTSELAPRTSEVNAKEYNQPVDSSENSSQSITDEVTSFTPQHMKDYENGNDFEHDDELSRIESNVELSRRATRSLLNTEELLRTATQSSKPLPPMGGGKPYPPALPSRDPYMIAFDGPDDPGHPHNYPLYKK